MDYMLLSILLSAILTLSGCSNETSASEKSVTTEGIKSVTISGDASLIRLNAKDDQKQLAVMSAKPSGWLSGWFYNDCKSKGEMIVSGQTLLIKAKNSSWYDLSECSTYLQINLPRNAGVTINQPAFKGDLQGQFADPEPQISTCKALPPQSEFVVTLSAPDCNLMVQHSRNRLILPVARWIRV